MRAGSKLEGRGGYGAIRVAAGDIVSPTRQDDRAARAGVSGGSGSGAQAELHPPVGRVADRRRA